MQNDLILHQPDTINDAELILMFHGVGSSAEDMRPLGQAFATMRPNAWIISVRSPDRSDLSQGWQWFSVQGVTETNRPERVAAAMPAFLAKVDAWQQHTGLSPQHTTLLGFSQGAIMALESTQHPNSQRVANRIIAISGRFASPPRQKLGGVVVHLIHGEQDRVVPIALAVEANRALQALGVTSTLDRFAGLGHGIDARVVKAVVRRLNEPAAVTSDVPFLWLHIGAEELVVSGAPGDTGQHLDLGASRIARDFFHHDPPTAGEIEQAIDVIEDQIMRLGPRRDVGIPLHSTSETLQPWAAVSTPTISIETVEQWFERLALAAQGHSAALVGLPLGPEAAAALLVLREFMHHRNHPTIHVVDPRQAHSRLPDAAHT